MKVSESKLTEQEKAKAQFIKEGGEEVTGMIPFHFWKDTELAGGIEIKGVPFIRCTFIQMDEIMIKGKSKTFPLVKENGELKHLTNHADLISKLEKLNTGDEVFIELTDEVKDTGNVNPMLVFEVLKMPKKK